MSNFLKNFASAIDSEMEKIGRDESNIVEENEPQLLYTSVIRKWLEENSELQIENILPENKDWRVFGHYYIYTAYNEKKEKSGSLC